MRGSIQRVRHTLGDSAAPWIQVTSNKPLKICQLCRGMPPLRTPCRKYQPPFLHPGWHLPASDVSCDRELSSSPVSQALLQGITFPESIWELVWVSLCQPLLQTCGSVRSKRATKRLIAISFPQISHLELLIREHQAPLQLLRKNWYNQGARAQQTEAAKRITAVPKWLLKILRVIKK